MNLLEKIQTAPSLNTLAWVVISELDTWFEWCHAEDTEARLVLLSEGGSAPRGCWPAGRMHASRMVVLGLRRICREGGVSGLPNLAPPLVQPLTHAISAILSCVFSTDRPSALVLSRSMASKSEPLVCGAQTHVAISY